MEKECPICGVLFETDNPIRKYCDKCRNHPEREMKKVETALRCSKKRMYEPQTEEVVCELCGRHNVIPVHLLSHVTCYSTSSSDGHDHIFCCREHRDEWSDADRRAHAVCAQCGVSMAGSPKYVSGAINQFCSDECHNAFRLAAARKAGNVHTCVYCKKEYIRAMSEGKKTYFCSRECQKKAFEAGWGVKHTQQLRKNKQVTVTHKCTQCGKPFRKTYKDKYAAYQSVNCFQWHFCSKECVAIHRASEKERFKKQAEERNKKKEAEFSQSVDLCATCMTPYKECERMSTNFRMIPEGAHYNENGRLSVCPKYKQAVRKGGGSKK